LLTWLFAILKLVWGIYLVLTSIYCLLAFLPYTYFALIKAPPYEWMPWFAHHQAVLYWIALLAVAITQVTWSRQPTERRGPVALVLGILALAGVYLSARPFLSTIQSNWAAYKWSLAALALLALVAALDVARHWPQEGSDNADDAQFSYSSAVLIAVFVALLYEVGSAAHSYSERKSVSFNWGKLELTTWSVISHILVGLIVVSVLNLILIACRRTRRPRSFTLALVGLLVFTSFWIGVVGFLNSALTFEGWAAHGYAASLAATLTLLLGSVALPFLAARRVEGIRNRSRAVALWAITIALSLFAVALPTLIAGGDWNGVLQHAFTLLFWISLSVCVYVLRPRRASYSVVNIVAVLLLSGFTYKALQATDIFWGKPLGATDDDIARALETYAADNISFQMAHHILGNERETPCGDLCRIMRQYTNIRDAEARTEVNLVDHLLPTQGERPNIFIFVIDSVRPDYLGAYNPKVDFTPNLDAFARDSIVVHNAYTQYAGTTLSEPAIWSGAMLLHAHYMQPFSRVNSLEKLANVDGYQMMVSFDTVLSQILSPSDHLIKLDADKPWNQVEVCSTLQQTESALEARPDKSQPVLFYTQPMNVHQFAHNSMPRLTAESWRTRDGFNNRIAYELHQVDSCLGGFFAYLKARKLYDNSIVIVASDHGDATGEFGRYSHSITIYPEIMRVPLLVHLPEAMRRNVIHDDTYISALTDITPSLYYLLGHRPIRSNPIFGHSIFVATPEELKTYRRDQLFLASDERAVYGLLTENGRFLYATYDSPSQSFLFDLSRDPNAQHSILTDPLKQHYDEQIIDQLHTVADFYGYKPGVGSLLAAAH
jgi:hypothetical protein